jgi:hypothetical protein
VSLGKSRGESQKLPPISSRPVRKLWASLLGDIPASKLLVGRVLRQVIGRVAERIAGRILLNSSRSVSSGKVDRQESYTVRKFSHGSQVTSGRVAGRVALCRAAQWQSFFLRAMYRKQKREERNYFLIETWCARIVVHRSV